MEDFDDFNNDIDDGDLGSDPDDSDLGSDADDADAESRHSESEDEDGYEDEDGRPVKTALPLDDITDDLDVDDVDDADAEENDDVTLFRSVTAKLKHSTKGTSAYLTKYEKARIIGVRASQLERGAPSLVDTTGMISVAKIAEKELAQGLMPLTINRPYPNGKIVVVPVSQLIDVIPQI